MPSPPTHGIQRHPLKYLVFAGNYRQFDLWREAQKIPEGEALFVASPSNLLGRKGEFTLVKVGTFHLRPDAQEIMEAVRMKFPKAEWITFPIS